MSYIKIFFCKQAVYGNAAGGIMIPMGKCKKNQHQTPYRCESNGKHCRFYEPSTDFAETTPKEIIAIHLNHIMAEANWSLK